MLLSLQIENFAIVKHLELDFLMGMTAFTGETGAGKSIMIDALSLLLGGRADASVVRQHEEKCSLSACFEIAPNSEPAQWLAQHDLDDAAHEILIRRIIYAEGRSKCYINGQAFPVQKVKELGEMLVHIHGQHEHQTLLQHTTHRQQLDLFANHDSLLEAVTTHYRRCAQILDQLKQLKSLEQTNTGKIDLLQYQIEELTALRLEKGEIQSLNYEHQRLHHAHDYLRHAQHITDRLSTASDSPTVDEQLQATLNAVAELPQADPLIKNTTELLSSALIQCQEACHEIQRFADTIQLDPSRLQDVEARISVLHQMARKYHLDIDELPDKLQALTQELDTLQTAETRIQALNNEYQRQVADYQTAAMQLRASRQTAAQQLSSQITTIIQKLGMPKGRLEVAVTEQTTMQAHGLDKVEYLVCTNPGMPLDCLQKIASGGELSRISLAIQMITAQQSSTPTLLFDEVDVGIGGATAALVGQLLRQVSERLQVFCVTHQAQVASCAHHHFLVEKSSDEQQTYTHINVLSQEAKINEIARMLGGLTITNQTLSHAQELLLSAAH